MLITNIIDLRKKSEKAEFNEIDNLVEKLELELSKYKTGIGLSAIQIGILKKISIIRTPNLQLNLINPIIIQKYDKFRFKGEACLSFPGLVIDTSRYYEIVVINNEKEKIIFVGLEAVIVQHEIDHLNGLTILDRKWRKR